MIRVSEEGITLSTPAYTSNSKRMMLNIEIDKRVRKTTERWKTKNRLALHVVVMNMIACVDKRQRLYYLRGNTGTLPPIYNVRKLSNFNICAAVDELQALGYLFNYIASRQYGEVEDKQSSYIVPTEAFIDKFCTKRDDLISTAEINHVLANVGIELRDKKKNSISFEFNESIAEAERVVTAVNLMNYKHIFLDYEGKFMVNMYGRIFNNESFFFGGRWFKAAILKIKNKKTNNRLRTTIDGESIVEIDFDCLHINMLSDIMGVSKYRGIDIYYHVLDKQNYSTNNRRLVKLGINIMLNATSEYKAKNAIDDLIAEEPKDTFCYSSGDEVVKEVYKKLPEFKSKFCNKECTGLVLQNKDSWIAHYVLDEFVMIQQPVLVVHDSFIVQRKNSDKLVDAMSSAYKRVVEVDRVVSMKINWLEGDSLQAEDCSK